MCVCWEERKKDAVKRVKKKKLPINRGFLFRAIMKSSQRAANHSLSPATQLSVQCGDHCSITIKYSYLASSLATRFLSRPKLIKKLSGEQTLTERADKDRGTDDAFTNHSVLRNGTALLPHIHPFYPPSIRLPAHPCIHPTNPSIHPSNCKSR